MALGSAADGDAADRGFVGRPLPDRLAYIGDADGTELAAGEIGEVFVTHGFFSEYCNKPDKTAETKGGRLLHTGDVGFSDDDVHLKVMGRTHEVAGAERRGGFLRELEDVYYDHDDVLHTTVVEGSDGTVEAFVELLPGRQATADTLQEAAARRVVPGLVPARTTVLEGMPRTFSGKADRLKRCRLVSNCPCLDQRRTVSPTRSSRHRVPETSPMSRTSKQAENLSPGRSLSRRSPVQRAGEIGEIASGRSRTGGARRWFVGARLGRRYVLPLVSPEGAGIGHTRRA